jgi:hypothetical protein
MPAHPAWYAPPQPGDIVQCWFPQDKFAAPGPKSRPALVMRVDEFEVAGQVQADVTIAYGTSTTAPVRAGQFVLLCVHAAAGLARDTKFDLTNQCTLPFNNTWFCAPPGQAATAPPVRRRLPLERPDIKKAFIAAYNAAITPVNLTKSQLSLARPAQKTRH